MRIGEIDTEVYAAAHKQISDSDRRLRRRWTSGSAALRATEACPPELVETAVPDRRRRTAGTGEPSRPGWPACPNTSTSRSPVTCAWSGFNYYLGGFASRVAVNADIGHRMSQFGVLVAHECYPGPSHRTLPQRGSAGQARWSGRAHDLPGQHPAVPDGRGSWRSRADRGGGPGWGRWLAEVLDGIGPAFDADLVEALEVGVAAVEHRPAERGDHAARPGVDPEDVIAYQRRGALASDQQARQRLRFMTDPLWRAYTSTYVEGDRLLRPWLEARDPGRRRCNGSSGCSTSR